DLATWPLKSGQVTFRPHPPHAPTHGTPTPAHTTLPNAGSSERLVEGGFVPGTWRSASTLPSGRQSGSRAQPFGPRRLAPPHRHLPRAGPTATPSGGLTEAPHHLEPAIP